MKNESRSIDVCRDQGDAFSELSSDTVVEGNESTTSKKGRAMYKMLGDVLDQCEREYVPCIGPPTFGGL